MAVLNIHERRIPGAPEQVGALIDGLASAEDPLWPVASWPRMRLDRGLSVGSRGGHGPIGYTVVAYVPGRLVRFQFSAPRGFEGFHEFTAEPADSADSADSADTTLRHIIAMRLHGSARLSWPLAFRWLHDALVEECLDRAVHVFKPEDNRQATQTPYVRLLRRITAQAIAQAKRRATA